jgi:hypothetical protein
MDTVRNLPRRAVAARYKVCARSIVRWEDDEELGFPKSFDINGRRYFREDELDEFDRQCALRATRRGLKVEAPPSAKPDDPIAQIRALCRGRLSVPDLRRIEALAAQIARKPEQASE